LRPLFLHYADWLSPVPLPGPVNTAGAEDYPFITPDGSTFFFTFTPDVNVPPQKSLLDGVTGIGRTHRVGNSWSEPPRVILETGPALDGCPFFDGHTLWFCAVRSGNYSEVDVYAAELEEGRWLDVRDAGPELNQKLQVGEFHLSPDGLALFFGWPNHGRRDLWKVTRNASAWEDPVNLGANVNSRRNEDQPFLSSNGQVLWFTGDSRLGYPGASTFRSLLQPDGSWGPAQEVVSRFAGEPTLDDAGNLYFVHHFFSRDGKMIEADIYLSLRK
jgi:hypothetical protein